MIFEESKQQKATQGRLEDLLLPGTSAAFTAIPSSAAMKMDAKALAFRIRMQFGLEAKLGGFYRQDAFELALEMGRKNKFRNLRHNKVNDALLDASVASNLVACREPEKHFHCHNGTGLSVTPDGVISSRTAGWSAWTWFSRQQPRRRRSRSGRSVGAGGTRGTGPRRRRRGRQSTPMCRRRWPTASRRSS